jgi:hypothetical protein
MGTFFIVINPAFLIKERHGEKECKRWACQIMFLRILNALSGTIILYGLTMIYTLLRKQFIVEF